MDLPDDERQLLAGYARIIGEIDAPRVYRITALRPLLRDCKAEVCEYPHYPSSDESADVDDWARRYVDEMERTKVANKHLAERKLITLVHHESEIDVVVIGLTLAGYDAGREFAKTGSTIIPLGAIMDILISWSKSKSKQLARVLYSWLPNVLPGVKPWMSEKDIEKGTEWFGELQTYLGQAKACVIVVTDENVRSSWLYYEAGAIAVKGPEVRVCPYLVGVEAGLLADGPLGKFQCTIPTKDDTLLLIYSLNKRLGGPHHEQLLKTQFEAHWPALEAELARVQDVPAHNAADFIRTPADELGDVALSASATMLLLEAAQDGRGIVMVSGDLSGLTIGTNGKVFNQPGDPRSEAHWMQAVNDLASSELLEQQGEEVYSMTEKGYRSAEAQQQRPPVKELDENDIISILEGHLATNRDKLASMTLRFDDVENQLRLPPGSVEKFINKAAETVGHKVRRKGSNTVTFDQDIKRRSLAELAAEGHQRRVSRG